MYNIRYVLLFLMIFLGQNTFSQTEHRKLGFYFQPFYSGMFLENHIGNSVGFNIGLRSKNEKWEFGIRYYGRSGPINENQTYELILPEGTTYKGKSVLNLAADHGYGGVEIAYHLPLNAESLSLRIPLSVGQVGAGFYLLGEDRETPDGRRVNEWEDELQDGTDAGFGIASEIGLQLLYQLSPKMKHLKILGGAHYMNTYGYESFLGGNDFYNNKLRVDVGIWVGF
ncbi:MAG: hypothetical protein AAF696_13660 [Bacteroidota bacterium]